MAVDATALVHSVQKVLHLWRAPPIDACDEEVGKVNSIRGKGWHRGLYPHHGHVGGQPGVERLDRLGVRFDRVQAKSVGGSQRAEEHVLWQPSEAHVLVHTHGILKLAQSVEPDHRHEMTL
eukprot:6711051-Prymnesium_polylepis.1